MRVKHPRTTGSDFKEQTLPEVQELNEFKIGDWITWKNDGTKEILIVQHLTFEMDLLSYKKSES